MPMLSLQPLLTRRNVNDDVNTFHLLLSLLPPPFPPPSARPPLPSVFILDLAPLVVVCSASIVT